MVRSCIYCKEKQKTNSKISFFQFPRNPAMNELWLKSFPTKLTPTAKSFLCSKHFEKECYSTQFGRKGNVLKLDAVPTIFDSHKEPFETCEANPDDTNSQIFEDNKVDLEAFLGESFENDDCENPDTFMQDRNSITDDKSSYKIQMDYYTDDDEEYEEKVDIVNENIIKSEPSEVSEPSLFQNESENDSEYVYNGSESSETLSGSNKDVDSDYSEDDLTRKRNKRMKINNTHSGFRDLNSESGISKERDRIKGTCSNEILNYNRLRDSRCDYRIINEGGICVLKYCRIKDDRIIKERDRIDSGSETQTADEDGSETETASESAEEMETDSTLEPIKKLPYTEYLRRIKATTGQLNVQRRLPKNIVRSFLPEETFTDESQPEQIMDKDPFEDIETITESPKLQTTQKVQRLGVESSTQGKIIIQRFKAPTHNILAEHRLESSAQLQQRNKTSQPQYLTSTHKAQLQHRMEISAHKIQPEQRIEAFAQDIQPQQIIESPTHKHKIQTQHRMESSAENRIQASTQNIQIQQIIKSTHKIQPQQRKEACTQNIQPQQITKAPTHNVQSQQRIETFTQNIQPSHRMETSTHNIQPQQITKAPTHNIQPQQITKAPTHNTQSQQRIETSTQNIQPQHRMETSTHNIQPQQTTESSPHQLNYTNYNRNFPAEKMLPEYPNWRIQPGELLHNNITPCTKKRRYAYPGDFKECEHFDYKCGTTVIKQALEKKTKILKRVQLQKRRLERKLTTMTALVNQMINNCSEEDSKKLKIFVKHFLRENSNLPMSQNNVSKNTIAETSDDSSDTDD